MKRLLLMLPFPLVWTISFAQDKTNAEKLVKEGIALHNKGEYDEMKEKNDLETFAYISLVTKKDQYVNQWLSTNESKIKDFFDWSESFKWKTN